MERPASGESEFGARALRVAPLSLLDRQVSRQSLRAAVRLVASTAEEWAIDRTLELHYDALRHDRGQVAFLASVAEALTEGAPAGEVPTHVDDGRPRSDPFPHAHHRRTSSDSRPIKPKARPPNSRSGFRLHGGR